MECDGQWVGVYRNSTRQVICSVQLKEPGDRRWAPPWRMIRDGTDLNKRWRCVTCGQEHVGLFDLVSDHPAPWSGQGIKVLNSEMRPEPNILGDDFCIIEELQFFIRCRLRLPIMGRRRTGLRLRRLGFTLTRPFHHVCRKFQRWGTGCSWTLVRLVLEPIERVSGHVPAEIRRSGRRTDGYAR